MEQSDIDKVDAHLDASGALEQLADLSASENQAEWADRLYRLAADIELRSEELQRCWGGPLNGQAGRQATFKVLIDALKPTAIVETGSFRGLSTQWLADQYQGPIRSCELKPLYFHQAVKNTARFSNVRIENADSCAFLEALDAADVGARPLIYLDSHWEAHLPLREELDIVARRFPDAVVAIDDFRVPGDNGYGWDYYGPEKTLEIGHIAKFAGLGYRLYFPSLPSTQETGAVRGFCVASKAQTEILDRLSELKGGTLTEWEEVARNTPETPPVQPGANADTDAQFGTLSHPERVSFDSRRRALVIDRQAAELAAAMAFIDQITEERNAIDADRHAKQAVVDRLAADLAAVDADRNAKQAVVDRLVANMATVDADRIAKQAVIDRLVAEQANLNAHIAAIEADCREKQDMLARMAKEVAGARRFSWFGRRK